MLFLARSALCIGLVAAAASNAGSGTLATALDRGARDAATAAGRACLGSGQCLRLGAGALAAASAPSPVVPAEARRGAASTAAPHRPVVRAAMREAPPRHD